MSEDEFTKLFKYMQSEFEQIHDQLNQTATREDLNKLTGAVDAYAKQSDMYMQEMLSLGNKVDRLEQWILKVAESTGVKLAN